MGRSFKENIISVTRFTKVIQVWPFLKLNVVAFEGLQKFLRIVGKILLCLAKF